MKLFGTSREAKFVSGRDGGQKQKKTKQERQKKPLKTLAVWLTVLLALEGLYFFCVYTQNAFVKKWRNIYINTAMDTMTHQWLATAFLPKDVIDQVRYEYGLAKSATIGQNSTWGKEEEPAEPSTEEPQTPDENIKNVETEVLPEEDKQKKAEEAFYELFYELDRDSMQAWLDANPSALDDGWDHIYVNQAGFEEEGTEIYTTLGEQVLALDAKNGVLVLRVQGSGYRGALGIAKDPSRLSIEMSATLGVAGEVCGTIAEAHGGVLAMNASGFLDPNGGGNGGQLAGYCMSNGTAHGSHFTAYAYKRIELHEDNLMYIKDVFDPVSEDCTDATEFQPAMIVDGKKLIDYEWTGEQPRACIGQNDKYEILMLVIEGRQPLRGILGTNVNTCSDILLSHGCQQAMNVDGGSSAMLWFDGKYVISSSSAPLRDSGGRPLPNAWVYKAAE